MGQAEPVTPDEALSPEAAAALLGLPVPALRRLLARGALPGLDHAGILAWQARQAGLRRASLGALVRLSVAHDL